MTKEKGNIFIKNIERRKRLRAIVVYSLAILGAVGLFVVLGFVGKKQGDTRCWKLMNSKYRHLPTTQPMILSEKH